VGEGQDDHHIGKADDRERDELPQDQLIRLDRVTSNCSIVPFFSSRSRVT
jgi:hypothetical protein